MWYIYRGAILILWFDQIEYDGFWYDARVTAVDGDEIEYIDWDGPTNTTQALDDS